MINKKTNIIILTIIIILFTNCAISGPSSKSEQLSSNYVKRSDSHLHYVDFIEETDGISALLKAMDDAGIENVMISGLPLIKKWNAQDEIRPRYYLDNNSKLYYYSLTDEIIAKDVKSLPLNQQHRFHPFICGFNPTDKNAIDHIIRLMSWYPNFWQGIGEILTRHGSLTDLTEGPTATANNPALDLIYNYAAKHHLPVLVHSDISTTWSQENSTIAEQPIYMHEIEDAVRQHPHTTFIWAHAGLDRNMNVPNLVNYVDSLLGKYNNLYIDISGVTLEYIVHENKVDPNWLKLITKYPQRIFIGTDAVGHFDHYKDQVNAYNSILNSLQPNIANKVASTNFLSILPESK